MASLPWSVAWHDALYAAERGFYVTRGGPSAHFTTATHGVTGAVLAESLLRLWSRSREDLPAVVVDVGAGRGELATHLCHGLLSRSEGDTKTPTIERAIGDARIVAVDVVDRPHGLDPRIRWVRSPGGAGLPPDLAQIIGSTPALVIAHEWLDVVPCTIGEVDEEGTLREVLVDPASGRESLGGPLPPAELAWLETAGWSATEQGERVEVGTTRDEAWRRLVDCVHDGVVVAVDYGHTRSERPRGGSLAAYRGGVLTDPVPDGSCDVTTHVAMDTLGADELRRQRELLRDLGIRGEAPGVELARTDPLGYVRALERAGAEAELVRRGGFGDFWWAVTHVSG